jgi:hypothetical protein
MSKESEDGRTCFAILTSWWEMYPFKKLGKHADWKKRVKRDVVVMER